MINVTFFSNCRAITYICSSVKVPFEIDLSVFSDYSKPTLYVPDGTAKDYKGKGGWEQFQNVVEGYLVDVPTIDDMTYLRIRNGEGSAVSGTAILTKSATTTPDVVIPDTIKLKTDDISYKVKTISESAFINNSKLVNLTIPEFLDSIGQKAFNGCSNIAYIISKVKKPFTINDNVFSITTPTLYVPVGSRVDYKNTDGWKKFTTIYEGEKKDTSVVDNGTEFSVKGHREYFKTGAFPKDYNIELIAHWRNSDKPRKLISLDTIRFNYYSFNKPTEKYDPKKKNVKYKKEVVYGCQN